MSRKSKQMADYAPAGKHSKKGARYAKSKGGGSFGARMAALRAKKKKG